MQTVYYKSNFKQSISNLNTIIILNINVNSESEILTRPRNFKSEYVNSESKI